MTEGTACLAITTHVRLRNGLLLATMSLRFEMKANKFGPKRQ